MSDDFKYISFTEVAARKKLGVPDSWEMCGWELIGNTLDCLVKGGIPRPLKSGKNKGRRTWRDSEISKVCVTDAEEYQAKLDYEHRTGACWQCQGRSKMYIGWNCDTGNKYAPCTRCGSTGRNPNKNAPDTSTT